MPDPFSIVLANCPAILPEFPPDVPDHLPNFRPNPAILFKILQKSTENRAESSKCSSKFRLSVIFTRNLGKMLRQIAYTLGEDENQPAESHKGTRI